MTESLREHLIGAWELIDLVEEPEDGSPGRYPMGEDAVGLIVYTAGGFMSVQIMAREHVAGAGEADDPYGRTAEDFATEARTYFAYSGPFEVDEEHDIVVHKVRTSLYPGWVGQDQRRAARLDGEVLELSSAEPSLSSGVLVRTRLRWRPASPR